MICRMACVEKGVPHLHNEVTFSSRKLARENPLAAAPSMRHGKVRLFGVRGITSYIDSRFKGRNLVPADPIRAAEVEQWTAAILHRLHGLADHATCQQFAQDASTAKCLGALNDTIGSKFWLVGRGFTLADIALMPAIGNLNRLMGQDQLLHRFPALGLWFAKHNGRRSWQAVQTGGQDVINA